MPILAALPLALLRFELETLEAATVPPYKGDLLRMALLWWLSEFWCPEPTRCREGCRRPDICMFGRLCTPAVDPSWSPQVRRLLGDEAPGAYVLWDERDRRTQLLAGSNWVFTLTLIADLALRQLPAIIAAVQQGAEQGMGRIRLRILSEVHGGGEWPHDEWGPLLDAADAVRLDHHETQWLSYARRSQASGVYNVEGFIGNGWYSGEALRPLLPYLWLGQWLHVGKGYVSGNGCYRLHQT